MLDASFMFYPPRTTSTNSISLGCVGTVYKLTFKKSKKLGRDPPTIGGQERFTWVLGLDVLCLLQQQSFPFSCGHRMSAAGSSLCLPAGSFEDETLRIAGPFSA